MANDENKETINKKAIIVVAIQLLLVGLFLVLFFVVFNDEPVEESTDTVTVQSDMKISEDEKIELESLAESYVQEAGNFGVKKDQITENNIDEMATLLETDPQSAETYFASRRIVYEGLDQFIHENSPLYYSPSIVDTWSDEFETSSRASFSVESVEASAMDSGSFINVNGENLKSASVKVNFTTKETMFIEQGSEIGAERSYSVMEKDFDNTATFVFVYEEHEEEQTEDADHSHGSHWKLYNINNLENEFVLASWADPNVQDFADSQFNFVENGKIVPSNQNIESTLAPEEE